MPLPERPALVEDAEDAEGVGYAVDNAADVVVVAVVVVFVGYAVVVVVVGYAVVAVAVNYGDVHGKIADQYLLSAVTPVAVNLSEGYAYHVRWIV